MNRHSTTRRAIAALAVLAIVVGPLTFAQQNQPAQNPPAGQNAAQPAASQPSAEKPKRVFEREPYLEMVLKSGEVVKCSDIVFPDGKTPTNPTTMVKARLVDQTAEEYEIQWGKIAEIRDFEQIVLNEAAQLVEARKIDEAFDYYIYLQQTYGDKPSIKAAVDRYIFADALNYKSKGAFDQALGLLNEVHARNPAFTGLDQELGDVTSRLIEAMLKKDNYAAARRLLLNLSKKYPENPDAKRWEAQIAGKAREHLSQAQSHFAASRPKEALAAVREATRIFPLAEARTLWEQIHKQFPRVAVGVHVPAGRPAANPMNDWAARRSARLIHRRLMEFQGYGPEGGMYRPSVGEMEKLDLGLRLSFHLQPQIPWSTGDRVLTANDVARRLISMADPGHYAFRADWADLCAGVTVRDVYNLDVELRRGHVHPDGMLQTILTPWDAPNDPAAPVPAIGPYVVESADAKEVRYLANAKYFAASSSQPKELAEVYYNDPRKAVAALRSGEVALLDRVHPWDVESLRATTGLTVERYAVPTVHCLMLNFEKDFLAKRSFRRALVHGINRQEILNTQLLRGSSEELGKVVSGPFPRGTSLDDPTGYAYNEEIEPRPYDPRLAMILISLTRYEVKLANEKKEEAAAGGKPAPKAPAKTPEEEKKDLAANLPPVPALVLAHAPHEIARVACRSIQRQLKPLGLNITLKELPPESPCTPEGDWDLLYTELAMWEPVVDARQLLGPYGLAGRCSPHMDLALRRLDLADDWKRARDRLLEIHRLFHEDLPLVPLWQITDFFAYQQGLKNVGSRPAMLYQNIENWDAPAWFGTEAL